MKVIRQRHHGSRLARLLRTTSAAAIVAALCLGTTACGSDLFGSGDADATPTEQPGQGAQAKPTAASVRAFYSRTTKAYRAGDARQLCRMTQPGYAAAMVEEAAAAGLDVSTCPEVWQLVIDVDPEGYQDKLSEVAVRGRTATLLSGDDPWRLRFVGGKWLIART